MNVIEDIKKDYDNKTLGESGKNKANSNPIKANSNPISAQKCINKIETNPIYCGIASGEAGTNPIYRAVASGEDGTCRVVASGEDGSKGKKYCCVLRLTAGAPMIGLGSLKKDYQKMNLQGRF